MAKRDIVVIGASAGGVDALVQIVKRLPADFEAALMIVLHTSSHTRSYLSQILSRATPLIAVQPQDGTPIERGRIYVARPDFHLLVERDRLRVVRGPRENLHRPSIDPLFRSAAAAYGPRVIGVILTGMLDDGTSGLMTVRRAGGAAIVEDPNTALFSGMPRSALQYVPDAVVASVKDIPKILMQLTREEVPDPVVAGAPDNAVNKEIRISEFQMKEIENNSRVGRPSVFGCPDCGGVLWEIDQEGLVRYRCRVGHAFTTAHLAAEQRRRIEEAIWAGLRALEESASLSRRLVTRAEASKHRFTAKNLSDDATNKENQASVLRDVLLQLGSSVDPEEANDKSESA